MMITGGDSEKKVTSQICELVDPLKQDCVLTCDVECSVHEGQNLIIYVNDMFKCAIT